MREVVIVSACRTPVGSFGGAFQSLNALDLGKIAVKEAIKRANIKENDIDECIMGCVLPAGLGQNPSRQVILRASLPTNIGCITVNKVCGSGLKAVMLAAQAIICGDAEVVIAGGMESMTNAPFLLEKQRHGYRMGNNKIVDSMINDGLWDHLNDFHMGISAELCAEKYKISRHEQDMFAVRSYNLSYEAKEKGIFKDEIVPVKILTKKNKTILINDDEGLKRGSLDNMEKLRPVFKKDGTVTPGNASSLNDGAAAFILMSSQKAKELNIKPLVRIGSQGSAGIEPKFVLVAPINSIPKVCKKHGINISEIDLHEINEAFASSSLAIQKTLKIDPSKININGGSLSIGHPIGASGGRVLSTLIYSLKKHNLFRGMVSLCLGGGEAVSLIIENI